MVGVEGVGPVVSASTAVNANESVSTGSVNGMPDCLTAVARTSTTPTPHTELLGTTAIPDVAWGWKPMTSQPHPLGK
eukprot:5169617-Amphidinium_carterae.1